MSETKPRVQPGERHFTASMIVIDPVRSAVLLVDHKASGLWVFPGGHIEPGESTVQAALREVREETGVQAMPTDEAPATSGATACRLPWRVAEFAAPSKPERPGKPAEPEHFHIDFLHRGVADSATPLSFPDDEVHGARWVPMIEVLKLNVRADVARLVSLLAVARGVTP